MIAVFGSINADLIFDVPALPGPGETVLGQSMRIEPGGKGANQALAAARDGAAVLLAGAVGQDSLAEPALALLRQAGVDLGRVAHVAGATGCAAICVDPHGRNQIAVASAANHHARADLLEDALLGPATTLVLQMELPSSEAAVLVRRARVRGCRIVLNLAPAAPLDEDALRALDVLVVNEAEAAWLASTRSCAPDARALHQALGITVVTTLGARGVAAAHAGGELRLHAHPVAVLDTTAAGDCFTGVLAAGLDRGLDLSAALHRANRAAALSCTRRGSQASLPAAADTDRVLPADR